MKIQQRSFHLLFIMDRWLIVIDLVLRTFKGILLRSEVDALWCGTDMTVSADCIPFTFRSAALNFQWEMWVKFLPDYTTLRLRRQHSSMKITFRFRGIVCVWHKRGHSLRDTRNGLVRTEYKSCSSLDGSNNLPVTLYGTESIKLISIPVIHNNNG